MTTTWVPVAKVDDVPNGDVRTVRAAGKEFALYHVEGQFFATSALCTHGFARMSDGFLEGFEIECPLHQGKFDVRNGKGLCAPITEALASYPARVENGMVHIGLSSP
jgi:naphthalene 1,2-dioxygenase ferredoxin component